jgi:hypothetical protein
MDKKKRKLLFKKENYIISVIGILFIFIGLILMMGGGSDDPNIFSDEIFSFRRIRIAPTLILIGFIFQVAAILKTHKNK